MPVIPRPAATVILMREIPSGTLQVFLLKRHEASAFMGGNFVYPGGRMDPEDGDPGILSHCRDADQAVSSGAHSEDTPESDLAYRICAIRELFEEAGVLLAYSASGENREINSNEMFAAYRSSIQKKDISLGELARREKLLYGCDQLFYLDRWVTPEARNIRFDTRFYLAFCPGGQEASPDQTETVQGLWMSPLEALQANLKAEIALSPPALETLELLSPFDDRKSVLDFVKNRQPRTVLPILTKAVDGPVILFPWDGQYGLLSRSEIAQPGPSRLREPDERTTRVLLRDGRWLPCRPGENAS